jgi:hypothetical protein
MPTDDGNYATICSMTVTVELKPEVEASIAAQAAAQGLSLEAYIQRVLDSLAEMNPPPVSPQERLCAFDEWIAGHSRFSAPRLPDEALSRESIYAEREDRQL